MSSLKKLPIEFWILILLPGLLIAAFFLSGNIRFFNFVTLQEIGFVGSFLLFVPGHLRYIFLIALVYGTGRSLFWVGKHLGQYFTSPPADKVSWWKHRYQEFTHTALMTALLTTSIATGAFYIVSALLFMGTFNPERILQTGLSIMEWDLNVFGVYLPFWMQGQSWSPLADQILLTAYLELSTIITLTVIGLVMLGKVLHVRQFILSFFLATFIAIPIWSSFPTVTPNELFRENVFALELESPTAMYAEAQSSKIGPQTTKILTKVANMQSRPDDNHYHVPTFPSMHVAWGIILVYFGFTIAWPVGITFLAWWILNIGGAVISLQHFGVDVIMGTIIGTCAFLLAKYLLHFEKNYLSAPMATYDSLGQVNKDIEQVITYLRNLLTKTFTSHKS